MSFNRSLKTGNVALADETTKDNYIIVIQEHLKRARRIYINFKRNPSQEETTPTMRTMRSLHSWFTLFKPLLVCVYLVFVLSRFFSF